MSIPTFNADGSGLLNLENLYENTTWPEITFAYYDDDLITPIELTGEWRLRLYKPENFPEVADFTFDDTNGIDISAHVLAFKKPDEIIVPAGRYQYFLLNKDEDEVFVIHHGSLTVKQIDLWQ